jgi:single-strand DNA-binding protein
VAAGREAVAAPFHLGQIAPLHRRICRAGLGQVELQALTPVQLNHLYAHLLANLRVAVTQRIQQDGQWRDGDTSFLKVNVWRDQAEHLADSLAKGDRVMVTGRLRQRSWETPEGDKRSVTELEADEVGASLKWATAKVERTSQRGNGERVQGRERTAERSGEFNDAPPF